MWISPERVQPLKRWIARLLEPICDADPSALANYVIALVKKDKSEQDLRAFCSDQLDVFLQHETSGFVDKLFEALNNESYPLELLPTGTSTVQLSQQPHEKMKNKAEHIMESKYGEGLASHCWSACLPTEISEESLSQVINGFEQKKYFCTPVNDNPEQSNFRHHENRVAMAGLQSKVDQHEREMNHLRKTLETRNCYIKELENQVTQLKKTIEEQNMCPTCD